MAPSANSFRFGPFLADRRAYRLTQSGQPVALPPKVLDLLFLLASQPSRLVTKDDILQALWPDVAVTDNAITQAISDLRHALGDSATAPRFVQTVPRRGYRFVAPVEAIDPPGEPGPHVVSPAQPPSVSPRAELDAARTGPRSVVVMNFTNVTGDADVDWLAAGLAETVTNDLRQIRDLTVIDRVLIDAATVSDVVARAGMDPPAPGTRPWPDLIVVGSFQRSSDRIRITARAVDVGTREALAHAKADGALGEVFELQDAIVTQLSSGLRLTMSPAAAARIRAHETSSLEAYRALTEGRLKLETLDPAQVPSAIADFERALALDGRYALAHVGLAHASFWRFQASRANNRPETASLRAAIDHARRAIAQDSDLAEAHSALAFFLAAADEPGEAIAAGRLAVALEPGNWRHHFRLGVAAWGNERLAALRTVVAVFPQMAYAHFGIAMVHVARGDLDRADAVLRQGIASESEAAAGAPRLPGSGLHWLLGSICLARGDAPSARAEFDRELAKPARGLFASEFALDADLGHAYARIAEGDLAGAESMLRRALDRFPDHARSWVAMAVVCRRQGRRPDAEAAMSRALDAIEELRRHGRRAEAEVTAALLQATTGAESEAVASLGRLLATAPAGFAGWTLPIEPFLSDLRGRGALRDVLARLSARAEGV